ncbi:MAG TPA: ATP-binding protein, partial [Candidatus Hydrogenedentes bacterium]|nr:ATP-binding protein [Candidatus Hydrogenedentota bacterium]
VAHDFNNLLQVVSGHIELTLNKVSANAAVAEQLRNAGDAVMRAARLVRQLLIFSRHQDLTRENLDLNVCVQELLKMLRRYIGEHVGILFRPDGSDMRFVGSAVQMEQLIMNLCINARDAMPAGGVITLETARETLSQIPADFPWASPGEYVRLCVRDTGCGMSRETLERVFEPFFSTKEVGKGTGMGLATVYGVVKQHNGVITVESAPGAGTVFCVFLPAGGEVPEKPHTDIEDIFLEDPGGVETILFAEDDPDIRKLGNTFLADAGYRVITAADGEDARRLFADHAEEISLVISDVIMPGLSGGRLHAEITAIRPGVPFLFTSGYSRDELRDTVLPEASGVILRKPYLRGRLLRAVRAVLDHAGPLPDEPDPRIL